MESSDSRAAVAAVLRGEQPRHIPFGVYAVDCDLASRILGRKTLVRDKVAQQLMLWEDRRDELAEALAADGPELYRKLDCVDVVLPAKVAPALPPRGAALPPADSPERVRRVDDDTWADGRGNAWKCAFDTNDVCQVAWAPPDYTAYTAPSSQGGSPEPAAPVAPLVDDSAFEAYDAVIGALRDDRFLAGHAAGFSPMVLPGGMEHGLMEYYLNPESVRAMAAAVAARHRSQDGAWLDRGLDAAFVEEDFATSRGPLMDPVMFRSFCLPVFVDRVRSVRRYVPWVFVHSCGDNHLLMDQYLEAGIDCYQSLQTGVMELGERIGSYGDRMTFWGGVPVELLVGGEPADVAAAVRSAYADAARSRDTLAAAGRRGGAFILGPSHSAAYGTSYDNFMAMLDEHVRLRDRY